LGKAAWMAGAFVALTAVWAGAAAAAPVGQFSDHGDIGGPKLPGSTTYDPRTGDYQVTGGGANMWGGHDAFQFAWKRMSGDLLMQTDLDFVSPTPDPKAGGYIHRKGGLIIRQDLSPDAVYVDALRMGNHQLSLQYREVKGGPTRLIWINTDRQQAIRLEKIGDDAYLFVPGPDGRLRPSGGSFRLKLTGEFYVGIGVCAHDDTTRETVRFSKLVIKPLPPGTPRPTGQTLETIQIATPVEQTALYHAARPITVLGWSDDSASVRFRTGGAAYAARAWDSDEVKPLAAGAMPPIPPAADSRAGCASGHADLGGCVFSLRPSPDGKWLAYLSKGATSGQVELRIAPMVADRPQADKAISLVKLHGGPGSLGASAWSPDSRLIAFVADD
jgi:TolB protein